MNSDKFLNIIENTPLVSIDIILKNSSGEVLLGRRSNRPAKGFWFVPGGRIRKNETLECAMSRISFTELGIELQIKNANLLGAFNHIYEDNFLGSAGVNTHYVALGYEIEVPTKQLLNFDSQHSEIKWWPIDLILENNSVHGNTKAYFESVI